MMCPAAAATKGNIHNSYAYNQHHLDHHHHASDPTSTAVHHPHAHGFVARLKSRLHLSHKSLESAAPAATAGADPVADDGGAPEEVTTTSGAAAGESAPSAAASAAPASSEQQQEHGEVQC